MTKQLTDEIKQHKALNRGRTNYSGSIFLFFDHTLDL